MIALAELAQRVAELRGDGLVVTGPGAMSGALWTAGHHPATIYNMELGYATSVALGAALAQPARPVFALEGDGSLLAALPVLATVTRHQAKNLTVVAVVNGIYGTGDHRTATQFGLGADFAAVAVGLGWDEDHVVRATDAAEFGERLTEAATTPGPWFIVADVDPASYAMGGQRARPGIDVVDSATVCRRFLATDTGP